MRKMFCEPLNEEDEPLAFFAVWVKDDETPKPTTCYLHRSPRQTRHPTHLVSRLENPPITPTPTPETKREGNQKCHETHTT